MAFHDEVMMGGGIAFEGIHTMERTDVSVQGVGTGAESSPHTLNLNITTGNATVCVVGITVADMKRLGSFLIDTANEKRKELAEETA